MIPTAIFVLILSVAQISLSQHWSYKDQDKWPLKCQKGIRQSPIDLLLSQTQPAGDEGFVGENWDKDHNVTLTNNGYTILVKIDNKEPIIISGGGLPGTFNLVQIHFHWNSEHTIDGQRKAFETHFIAYNTKFSSIKEAEQYENGAAAFAVLYNFGKENNDRLAPIVGQLGKLKNVKSSSKTTLNFRKLLPDNLSEFYRYWGSIARPDCNEVVVWTVFSELCSISQEQVNAFASIKGSDGKPLSANYRKIQPLNGRMVLKYATGPSF